MPPALVLLRIGHIRWLILPLPVFLLWPLLLLAWSVLGLAWLITSHGNRPGYVLAGLTILRGFSDLRGTKIDVWGPEAFFYLRFI